MAGKTMFTEAQVRAIKLNLVEGVSQTTLARMFGCSLQTIYKIKMGITYREVRVLGEERLRPEIEVQPLREDKVGALYGKTEAQMEREEEEGLAHLMKVQAEVRAANAARTAQGDGMVDELIAQKVSAFGAKV